ncbi:MAG: hypothetical protein WDM84_01810 [Bauldia sp.]
MTTLSPPTHTNFRGSDFGTEYQGDFTLGSNGTFLFGSGWRRRAAA